MSSFAATQKLKILKREPSAQASKIVEIMRTHIEQWYSKKKAPAPKGPPRAREEEDDIK